MVYSEGCLQNILWDVIIYSCYFSVWYLETKRNEGILRFTTEWKSLACKLISIILLWICRVYLYLSQIRYLQGERLSHAVGCAFAVCLERKQKRDKECSVTMNFDLTNSTFTRTGSFRQQTLTEKLQDTTHINNNMNSVVTAVSNSSTSNNPISTTTVININNNISANYNRKGIVFNGEAIIIFFSFNFFPFISFNTPFIRQKLP